MFKTRITELLKIERPIVQGGLQNVGVAELASACLLYTSDAADE